MLTEGDLSRRRIQSNLQQNLELLEDAFAGWSGDPTSLDHQLVNDLFIQRLRVKKGDVDISPQDQLTVLDDIEQWYADQAIEYPFPDHLAQRRAYWQGRIGSDSA